MHIKRFGRHGSAVADTMASNARAPRTAPETEQVARTQTTMRVQPVFESTHAHNAKRYSLNGKVPSDVCVCVIRLLGLPKWHAYDYPGPA